MYPATFTPVGGRCLTLQPRKTHAFAVALTVPAVTAEWIGHLPAARAIRVRMQGVPGFLLLACVLAAIFLTHSTAPGCQWSTLPVLHCTWCTAAGGASLRSPPGLGLPGVVNTIETPVNHQAPVTGSLRVPDIKIRRFKSRVAYSANGVPTFQLGRFVYSPPVLLAGDIELNPGPEHTTTRTGTDTTFSNNQAGIIRILHQNARSIRNKLGVMRAQAPELAKQDIFAVTETWLTEDVGDAELQVGLSSHTWFRRDRPTHGGGVACAVQSRFSPVRRQDLEPAEAELLVVELNTTPKIFLGVAYCPPPRGRRSVKPRDGGTTDDRSPLSGSLCGGHWRF